MSIRNVKNWIISMLGMLSITLSVALYLSPPVFAACEASLACGVSCKCVGNGSCSTGQMDGKLCVLCGCGNVLIKRCCLAGTE